MGKICLLTQGLFHLCQKQVIGIVWHSCVVVRDITGSAVDVVATASIDCHTYL